jgi:hypothetical protein
LSIGQLPRIADLEIHPAMLKSEKVAKQKQPKEPMPPLRVWAGPVALGWLVPGGGHFLLKRNGRAVLLLVSITLMYLCGLMMRGAMFQPQSGDLLTVLIKLGRFHRRPGIRVLVSAHGLAGLQSARHGRSGA